MLSLVPMTDADYAWLLGERARADGLTICDGGIGSDDVTAMLRGITAGLAANDDRTLGWMIAEGPTVIGMTSFTTRGEDGRYEIGYGVAPAYRGKGVMTRALAVLLPMLRADGHAGLTAATAVDNPASGRVLDKNGFTSTGTRDDPEDGMLVLWNLDLRETA